MPKLSPALRGIRGAIQVPANDPQEILSHTQELLQAMMAQNDITAEDITTVFFTVTPDLNAAFPAFALRLMGLTLTPSLCATEIDVPGGLPRMVRVLLQAYTRRPIDAIRHQYLGAARNLRPDLAGG